MGPFVALGGPLGDPWGPFGVPWGSLGNPLGIPRGPLGSLGGPLRKQGNARDRKNRPLSAIIDGFEEQPSRQDLAGLGRIWQDLAGLGRGRRRAQVQAEG